MTSNYSRATVLSLTVLICVTNVPGDSISTTDIIGGNSGSPIMNGRGEQVGIVFDSNYEGLGNDFFYNGSTGRTIAVDRPCPRSRSRSGTSRLALGTRAPSPAMSAKRETDRAPRSLRLSVLCTLCGRGRRVPSISLFLPATPLFGQGPVDISYVLFITDNFGGAGYLLKELDIRNAPTSLRRAA